MYTVEQFLDEMRTNWLDKYELPMPRKTGSLNGLTYMGTYLTLVTLVYRRSIAREDCLAIGKIILSCQQDKTKPGLLFRNPENTDQQGPDDYWGFGAACMAIGSRTLPEATLNYWHEHNSWMKNGKEFQLSCFFGRFPHLYAWLQFASLGSANWFGKLYLGLSLALDIKAHDQLSSDHISWMQAQWMKRIGGFLAWCADRWEKRTAKRYARGLAGIFDNYFEKNHPFTKVLAEHYGTGTVAENGEIAWKV